MKTLSTLLLVPLDDTVVFPNMNVTISADVGEEDRVLLVPRHGGEYAKVGTVAEVAERVRLPGGVAAVSLVGLHRGIAGAAHTDAQGRLRVEVQEQPDVAPPGVKTRDLEREYRAAVEEILERRGDDGRGPRAGRARGRPTGADGRPERRVLDDPHVPGLAARSAVGEALGGATRPCTRARGPR